MKKQYLFLIGFFLLNEVVVGQSVGINGDGSNPSESAILDVKSPNKGLLIPRVALTGKNDITTIPNPENSLFVYNTSQAGTGNNAVTPGFYYWNQEEWVGISTTRNISGSAWTLGGNLNTDPLEHFMGTLDNQPIRFKVNNQSIGKLSLDNIAFGYGAQNSLTTGIANMAIGTQSMFKTVNGRENVSIGAGTLFENISGWHNSALGTAALHKNISSGNTAVGSGALLNNTSGHQNVALGYNAALANTIGINNTIIGANAGMNANNLSNSSAIGAFSRVDCNNCLVLGSVGGINSADQSTKVGIGTTSPDPSSVLDIVSNDKGALLPRMTSQQKTNIPNPATGLLVYQTDGAKGIYLNLGTPAVPSWNVLTTSNTGWSTTGNSGSNPQANFIGTIDAQPLILKSNNETMAILDGRSLDANLSLGRWSNEQNSGINNISIGARALMANVSGFKNIAIGPTALMKNIDGRFNISIGAGALHENASGTGNIAIGENSLNQNISGNGNSVLGIVSLINNTIGFGNTVVGSNSFNTNTTGNSNTAIGYLSEVGTNNLTNATAIGANSRVDCSNCIVMGSISGVNGANATSRIGIGITNPDPAAMLDISSNSKGILLPRLTMAQRNGILSPSNSLLIYQTDNNPGFYFWNGNEWDALVTKNVNSLSTWSTSGNSGINPNDHFIGTLDNNPIVFKVNGQVAGKLNLDNISIGMSSLQNLSSGIGNMAVGAQSMFKTTVGRENVALGTGTLFENVTGSNNTALGTAALHKNTSSGNTAIGKDALFQNSSGYGNVALGNGAGVINSTGYYNTILGSNANLLFGTLNNAAALGAFSRVDCSDCLVLGSVAGINNASSSIRVGIGTTNPNPSAVLDISSTNKGVLFPRMTQAQRMGIASPANGLLLFQTDGNSGYYYNKGSNVSPDWVNINGGESGWSVSGNANINPQVNFIGTTDNNPLIFKVNNEISGRLGVLFNTSFGVQSLYQNVTGVNNVALGYYSLHSNTSGSINTATGYYALRLNSTGNGNSAFGTQALSVNTIGNDNTALGAFALNSNTSGISNTAIGNSAMPSNTSGQDNTAVGKNALYTLETGSQNTAIGAYASLGSPDLVNSTAIGYGATASASNTVRIGNGAVTTVESAGTFNTVSDGRVKYDVQENVKGLSFILKLRPVTYLYNQSLLDNIHYTGLSGSLENNTIRRTGFIAQEVDKAAKFAGFDFSGIGKPDHERDYYSLSYASFVVPLVKAIQEQNSQIDELKSRNESLKKEIDELRAMQIKLFELIKLSQLSGSNK